MRENDFINLTHKLFNNVWFTKNNANELIMTLDTRSDNTIYPIKKEDINKINNKFDYTKFILEYVYKRGDASLLENNFKLDQIEEIFDNFDFDKWYPEEYTVDDLGVDGGDLNVELNGNLIGIISSEDAQKEQPYLYIMPIKGGELCNRFVADCQKLWEENHGDRDKNA